jgi:hypothetical protein
VSTAVVAHGNAAPVFEAAEYVFDFMASLVKRLAIVVLDLAVFARRDAWGNAALNQCGAEFVAVIATVSEQFLGLWQYVKNQCSAFMVAHVPFREARKNWPGFAVADGVQLGVQAVLRSPNTAGNSPFFGRLAAVRWALR